MELRIGILIVGALYWDGQICPASCDQDCRKCYRHRWRENRLKIEDASVVKVPIRYGRRSKLRGNTYSSIVFDRTSKLGEALSVPCINTVHSSADLIDEAMHMWSAEMNGDNKSMQISANWGCSALLLNPECRAEDKIANAVIAGWAARVEEERINYENCRSVDKNGLLLIDWPIRADGQPLELDLLLATANRPDTILPSEKDVAQSFFEDDLRNVSYILRNHRSGIRTAYDTGIFAHIEELKAENIKHSD